MKSLFISLVAFFALILTCSCGKDVSVKGLCGGTWYLSSGEFILDGKVVYTIKYDDATSIYRFYDDGTCEDFLLRYDYFINGNNVTIMDGEEIEALFTWQGNDTLLEEYKCETETDGDLGIFTTFNGIVIHRAKGYYDYYYVNSSGKKVPVWGSNEEGIIMGESDYTFFYETGKSYYKKRK